MTKNSPSEATPNMRLAGDVALFAVLDQIVEQRPRHFRPEIAAHVQIGLEPAGAGFRLEAQRVLRARGDPVVDIGAEIENRPARILLDLQLDGEERRVFDDDADLLHRGDQEILVALALEHRGEQLDQSRPPNRRLLIEPGAVGGDPHVDIAAKRRIPQMDRRRPFAFARGAALSQSPPARPALPSPLFSYGIRAACRACSHLRDRANPAPEDSVDSWRMPTPLVRLLHSI